MTDRSATPGTSPRAMRVFKIVAALTVLALIGLVAWAIWLGSRPTTVAPAPSFDRFEPAWASAMAKAGVEATFPAGPVELAELTPSGRREFDATFTAEEVSALLNVYHHTGQIAGSDVVIDSADVTFPAVGRARLGGVLATGGSRYSAVAEGPASYTAGRIVVGRLTELTVEGFSVGGARRTQATEGLVLYFNEYLDAAPGLTVESARIEQGAVVVRGFAPVSLTNPLEP